MAASRYDFQPHHRGDQLNITLKPLDVNGDPWDLSGYTSAQMMIRTDPAAADPPTVTLTSAAGEIVIDTVNDEIDLLKTSTSFDIAPGVYWYDLELRDGSNEKTTIMYGKFKIIQDVTR